jgi:exonuclease III
VDKIPLEQSSSGYHHIVARGQRKGYNGVTIFQDADREWLRISSLAIPAIAGRLESSVMVLIFYVRRQNQ